MDVLTAYADVKNWVTAKAARPDVNRAGNAILRALAESRVRWAFWPPGTEPSNLSETGDGIWIRHANDDVEDGQSEGDREEEMDQDRVSESGEELDEGVSFSDEEDREGEELEETRIGGRFGALALEDSVTEETEEE